MGHYEGATPAPRHPAYHVFCVGVQFKNLGVISVYVVCQVSVSRFSHSMHKHDHRLCAKYHIYLPLQENKGGKCFSKYILVAVYQINISWHPSYCIVHSGYQTDKFIFVSLVEYTYNVSREVYEYNSTTSRKTTYERQHVIKNTEWSCLNGMYIRDNWMFASKDKIPWQWFPLSAWLVHTLQAV